MKNTPIETIAPKNYDVFLVFQLTERTPWENMFGVDVVSIPPYRVSQRHRHNKANTYLYILKGSGILTVGNKRMDISSGMRVHIPEGFYHNIRTEDESLSFVSIQLPMILNQNTSELDLELE